MSGQIIVVEGLSKNYHGRTVLNNISFDLHEGEIFGIFGANGAGKSVLIRMLATLEKADSGKISICGSDLPKNNKHIRGLICLVSDLLHLDDHLTVTDTLNFLLSAYSIKKERKLATLEYLLDKTGLQRNRDNQIQYLSAGFRQRLRLAASFLAHFKLFLFDEPFKDLDIWMKKKTIHHIQELANQGKGIILATHFLDDLKSLAHRLAIIQDGRFQDIVHLRSET